MWVKKQQLEPAMEQQTGSKLGKEYVKVVYCHPAYLTYMPSTSWETLGWKNHKLELEKAEEPEIKLPTSFGSSKKQEGSRKNISALLSKPKPLTMWITTNCAKFLKKWEYQTTLPASWEICMKVKKQQLVLDMEQTGYKSGKEYLKAVHFHPAYLTYI